jgi:hydrogenase maturation protease
MSNSSDRKPVAVIGIGNYLRGDDGAGIHAVERLRARGASARADVIDGATAGPSLAFYIEDRVKVIFIDAGDFGGAPGAFVRFAPADVRTVKTPDRFSLHGFDLMAFLAAPPAGIALPPVIVIYCIQVGAVAPTPDLGPEVKQGLESLVDAVLNELIAIP